MSEPVAWRWRGTFSDGSTSDWLVSTTQPSFAPYDKERVECEALYASRPEPVAVSEENKELARHFIERYATGIDDEPQMGRIIRLLSASPSPPASEREKIIEEAAQVADVFASEAARAAEMHGPAERLRDLHNARKGASQSIAFAIRALSENTHGR